MKIQNIGSYIGFTENAKINKKEETLKVRKYDVIDIKSESINKEVKLSDVKNRLVENVTKGASDEKLMRLKESIENGTYEINVDEIIKRMMG